MLNIADRPPPPGLAFLHVAKVLGFSAVIVTLVVCALVFPLPAAIVGMRMSHHMSAENAGLLAIGGGFIAGFWSSRILSRRCSRGLT